MKRNLTLVWLLFVNVALAERPALQRSPASVEPDPSSEVSISAKDSQRRGPEIALLVGGLASEYVSEGFQGAKSQHPLSFTGGVSFLFYSGRTFSIDTGIYYATPKLALGNDLLSATISYKTLEVPLLFRWNFLETLSLGVGGFLSQGLGDVSSTATGTTGRVLEEKESFEDAKIKRTDLGLAAGIQMRLPLSQKMRFLMDARYHHGMTNINSSTESDPVFTRSLRLLVGAAFSL